MQGWSKDAFFGFTAEESDDDGQKQKAVKENRIAA